MAIKEGRIDVNADGLIDPAQADQQWLERSAPPPTRKGQPRRGFRPLPEAEPSHSLLSGPPVPNFRKQADARDLGERFRLHRTEHEAQRARLAKLKADQLSGTLIPVERLEKAWGNVLSSVRDAVLAMPDRLSHRLVAETDADAVREILDDELRSVLKGLSNEMPGVAG